MGASAEPESAVMAQIYADALRHAGAAVSHQTSIGDDSTLLGAMDRADVDLFPAYTGTMLAKLAPEMAPQTADDTYNDLNRALPQGVSVGDPTPVNATPEVFVGSALASSTGIEDLTGCSRLPSGLPLLVIAEPTGQTEPTEATLRELTAAHCALGPVQRVPEVKTALARVASGSALGLFSSLAVSTALADGPADKIQALSTPEPPAAESSTTASRAPQSGTPQSGIPQSSAPSNSTPADSITGPPAQILVPVFRTAALSRDQVKAINKVAGEITTTDLAALAQKVRDGQEPGELATDWLAEHGI